MFKTISANEQWHASRPKIISAPYTSENALHACTHSRVHRCRGIGKPQIQENWYGRRYMKSYAHCVYTCTLWEHLYNFFLVRVGHFHLACACQLSHAMGLNNSRNPHCAQHIYFHKHKTPWLTKNDNTRQHKPTVTHWVAIAP